MEARLQIPSREVTQTFDRVTVKAGPQKDHPEKCPQKGTLVESNEDQGIRQGTHTNQAAGIRTGGKGCTPVVHIRDRSQSHWAFWIGSLVIWGAK